MSERRAPGAARRDGAARRAAAALALLVSLAPGAEGKTFRYSAGPKAPEDTVFTIAEQQLEPVVRKSGPKVPATNLEVLAMVANTVFDRTLAGAPLESGSKLTLAPAESHPLNFLVEHAILRHLSKRGITTMVRRSQIPDDSLATLASVSGADPVLEYQLASARVTYLKLRGWLPGRVKIERQALVEGSLTLRDPKTGSVLWLGDAKYNLVDAFPRNQLSLVEDARFTDLKGEPPSRNLNKVLEPIVVVAVVAGLVALFFQNRP